MATTTMENANINRKAVYWVIGIVAAIVLLLMLFSMRTFNSTPLDPGVSTGTGTSGDNNSGGTGGSANDTGTGGEKR